MRYAVAQNQVVRLPTIGHTEYSIVRRGGQSTAVGYIALAEVERTARQAHSLSGKREDGVRRLARQLDREDAANAHSALDVHVAPVGLHDAIHDRQA
jgi:hypothetical protein